MTANTEPRHDPGNLPPAAHVVLDRVRAHAGSTAHAIADATALGYETVAAALRALESAGLAHRVAGETGRPPRRYRWHPTSPHPETSTSDHCGEGHDTAACPAPEHP